MNEDEIALKTWEIYFPSEEYTIFNKEINSIIEIRKELDLSYSKLKEILESRVFECESNFFEQFNNDANNGIGNTGISNGNTSNTSTNNGKVSSSTGNTGTKCSPSFLKCFSCAVSEKLFETFNKLVFIETKIVNHLKISQFNEINSGSVDSLVSLVGTCCRAGFRKIENLEVYFECTNCSRIIKVTVTNNIYKNPKCNCKGKSFIFLPNHFDMKCIDKQEIKIQEIYSNESNTKVIEIDLYGSLVGTVIPGDLVKVTGIVKAELIGDGYKLKIDCNNLTSIKDLSQVSLHNPHCIGTSVSNPNSINTNQEHINNSAIGESDMIDYKFFKNFSENPNLIHIFTGILFSSIYGNELIKTGLVLSLFGGTRKFIGNNLVRSEIHILIIGDPGLGKSKLLLNTSNILHKSIYVTGSFCTTSGLTVSIVHDPMTGEYMADAGALVVSDGGICCIDEFDKIDDHTALLEVMEDQKVTVAKGGVCCSVPTRTTIIAASNPKYGHFDPKKSIKENIKFDSGLISRFDLVYILKDNLTEQENYKISNQILFKRQCLGDINNERAQVGPVPNRSSGQMPNGSNGQAQVRSETISSRPVDTSKTEHISSKPVLNESNEDGNQAESQRMENPQITKDILKQYIEYAKSSINPILSKTAKQKIKEYYIEIRKNKGVSIRNLESLIRLTESYAKLELKAVASLKHANSAIDFYKSIFIDNVDNGNENRKNKKIDFEAVLKEFVEENERKSISKEELSELIKRAEIKKSEEEYIEILNYKGVLIKESKNIYKINL